MQDIPNRINVGSLLLSLNQVNGTYQWNKTTAQCIHELQETWKPRLGLLSRSSSKDSLSVIEVRAMAGYCCDDHDTVLPPSQVTWPLHRGVGGEAKKRHLLVACVSAGEAEQHSRTFPLVSGL